MRFLSPRPRGARTTRPPLAILSVFVACVGLAPGGHAAEQCFACHAAPGLAKRIETGQPITPGSEAGIIKGKAHAGLTCLQCHPRAAEAPHLSRPGAVQCDSCHKGYRGHVVSGNVRQAPGPGGRTPTCTDCHGHHGILPRTDAASPVSHASVPDLCGRCHGPGSTEPYAPSYLNSVHGRAHTRSPAGPAAVCTDCHGAHAKESADTLVTLVSRPHLPGTCGKCHQKEVAAYRASIHGQAVAQKRQEAAVCTDCHGEHDIRRAKDPQSRVHPSHIPETCGQCHGAVALMARHAMNAYSYPTYRETYHGIANEYGSEVVANCASCHGVHDVRPSSDPRSSIHPANLARTCGKCHQGASANVTQGKIHLRISRSGSPAVYWVSTGFKWLTILTMAALVGHIVLDLSKRLIERRRSPHRARAGEGSAHEGQGQ